MGVITDSQNMKQASCANVLPSTFSWQLSGRPLGYLLPSGDLKFWKGKFQQHARIKRKGSP